MAIILLIGVWVVIFFGGLFYVFGGSSSQNGVRHSRQSQSDDEDDHSVACGNASLATSDDGRSGAMMPIGVEDPALSVPGQHVGTVNPATGLPMISGDTSGVDVAGNVYGFNNDDSPNSPGIWENDSISMHSTDLWESGAGSSIPEDSWGSSGGGIGSDWS